MRDFVKEGGNWRELQGANNVLRAKNRSSESIATALTRRIATVAEVRNV